MGDRRQQVRTGAAIRGRAADALAVGGDLVPDLTIPGLTALHATVVVGARPGGPRCGLDPLASGIHVRLLIMDFRGVGTRKGAPDLGECGLV